MHLKRTTTLMKDNLIDKYGDDYMYMNCIRFIKEVKVGVAFT